MSIPGKITKLLNDDPFMFICCKLDCNSINVERHHAFEYARRQIQEASLITPVCIAHHRINILDKDYFKYIGLLRSDLKYIQAKYQKFDWRREFERLDYKFREKRVEIIKYLESFEEKNG